MTSLQWTLGGDLVPLPITDLDPDRDRGAALLDELDDLISSLDATLADQRTARLVLADAESEAAIIEASITLTVEGRNEQERRARLTLALRDDAGYQELTRVAREARASLYDCERRLAVLKARVGLVRAAIALHIGRDVA